MLESLKPSDVYRNSVDIGVLVIDQAGIIQLANEVIAQLRGVSQGELQGKAYQTMLPENPEAIRQFEDLVSGSSDKLSVCRARWRNPDQMSYIKGYAQHQSIEKYGDCRVIFLRDVSEEVLFREHLKQQALILENVRDSIIVVDKQGIITYWNEAATELYGHSAEEMTGQPMQYLNPEFDIEQFMLLAQQDENFSYSGDWSYQRLDGKTVWADLKLSPLFEQGRVNGVIGVSKDITEKKEQEQQLKRKEKELLSIVNSQTNYLVRIDLERNYTYANAAYLHKFRHYGDVIGQSINPNIHPDDVGTVTNAIQEAINNPGKIVAIEALKRAPEASTYWLTYWEVVAITDSGDQPTEVLGVGYDITQRKEIEDKVDYLSKFNRLLLEISTTFINLNYTELNSTIKDALQAVTDFTDFERSYVYIFNEDKSLGTLEFEYYQPGVPPTSPQAQSFPAEPFPWWMNQILAGKAVQIPVVDELPAEAVNEKLALQQEKIKSSVAVPILYQGDALGYIGFVCFSGYKVWSEESVELLTLLGAIFANSLSQARTEKMLEQKNLALEESRASLALAQQIAKLGSYELQLSDRSYKLSDEFYRIFGFNPDTVSGEVDVFQFIHPEDVEYVLKATELAFEKNKSEPVSFRIIDANGELKYVNSYSQFFVNQQGEAEKMIGAVQDISHLRELERLLHETGQIAKVGGWEVDFTQAKVTLTPETYRIFDVPIGVVPNLNETADYFHPDDMPAAKKMLHDLQHRGEACQQEMRLITATGEEKWVRASGEVYERKNNQVSKIRGFIQDITESKRKEEAIKTYSERFTTATEQAEIGIWEHNMETNQLFWSDQMFEIFGVEQEGFGFHIKDWINCVHPKDVGWLLPELKERAKKAEKTYEAEYRIIRQNDKKVRYIKVVGKSFWKEGKMVRAIGTNWDITKIVKYEKNLLKKNTALQKANTELDHFVYSTSHNLRAPLTSIMGIIDLLRETTTEAERNHYVELINESIHKLDETIQEISDYSKNSRIEVTYEQVDLKELFEETYRSLSFMDNAHKLKIDIQVPEKLSLHSDPNRMKIIFNNLLSNAIKYCNPYQEESYLRFTAEQEKSNVKIIFTDNGIGIKPEYLDKVFNMFFRATAQVSGSGLGLYIVKETVDRLQGTIDVQSQLGERTTFTIVLPNRTKKSN